MRKQWPSLPSLVKRRYRNFPAPDVPRCVLPSLRRISAALAARNRIQIVMFLLCAVAVFATAASACTTCSASCCTTTCTGLVSSVSDGSWTSSNPFGGCNFRPGRFLFRNAISADTDFDLSCCSSPVHLNVTGTLSTNKGDVKLQLPAGSTIIARGNSLLNFLGSTLTIFVGPTVVYRSTEHDNRTAFVYGISGTQVPLAVSSATPLPTLTHSLNSTLNHTVTPGPIVPPGYYRMTPLSWVESIGIFSIFMVILICFVILACCCGCKCGRGEDSKVVPAGKAPAKYAAPAPAPAPYSIQDV